MPERTIPPTPRFSVFAHLQAEKWRLYRAVLGVFRAERERFLIALRPADVHRAMASEAAFHPVPEVEEITAALDQLVSWRNLVASRDHADVATVEDFYRQRLIYQFTPEGEAAEQALAAFERYLGSPGELQATALHEILRLLRALAALARETPLDPSKLHDVMRNLTDRFEQLTTRAQSFLRALQAPAELHGLELERFLDYKDALIDYLERFIGELVVCTNQIATELHDLEAARLDEALAAVSHHELADAFAPTGEDRAAALDRWRRRWEGLRRWFVAGEDGPSQAELLRARARAAVPALLTTIANLNDRRTRRTDRATDFHALALWFAEAPSERDLGRLWRAAFALGSCRHLRTNEETLARAEAERDGHRTSWLDATPLAVTPRLRRTGRYGRRGPAAAVIDRTAEKAILARLAEEEAAQIERAREALARGRPLRLAELGTLDPVSFDLFLELLGQALSLKASPDAPVETASADGSLHISLEPVPGGAPATLVTEHGELTGPDHVVTITRAGEDDAMEGGRA